MGAELAPPQLTSAAIMLKRLATKITRHRLLDIRGLRHISPDLFIVSSLRPARRVAECACSPLPVWTRASAGVGLSPTERSFPRTRPHRTVECSHSAAPWRSPGQRIQFALARPLV